MNRREFAILLGMEPLAARAADHKFGVAGKPLVLLPESARAYDIGHGEARILAGAEQSGGAWWLGRFLSEAGRKTSVHVHYRANEQFYVLEGTLSLWADSRWQDLPAGALAVMPRGVQHALGNRSKQPVRFLASGGPAGFERFFPDIEALAHRFTYGSPGFLDELAKVYKKYNSELLGPPPQGLKSRLTAPVPALRNRYLPLAEAASHGGCVASYPALATAIAPAGLYDNVSP